MALNLTFAQGDRYLLARVRGIWTAEGMVQAILDVAEEARNSGHVRVLLDATHLSAPESDFHRYIAGEQAARAFYEMRVAVVYPAGQINRFAQESAYVQGAELCVVPDFATALRWLSGSDADASA